MKKIILFSLLFSLKIFTNAQSPIIYPYNTPKSPNAASLGKFLEIPTDLHTGQINYSIPLEKIQFGEINVPITLAYQNSGLKVDELPSWVGLGWNLMAGGAITRTVRGLPDDCSVGLLNSSTTLTQAYLNQLSGTQRYLYFKDVAEGQTDAEHDVFYFEFCGQRGSFYIDNQGNCKQIPKGNNKITYTRENNNGLLNTFEITDITGIKYLFSIREDAITDADNSIYASTYYNNVNGSTWYLSKITSPSGREVNFEYNQFQIIFRNEIENHQIPRTGESTNSCNVGTSGRQTFGMTIYTPAYQLKKISWSLGKIDFLGGAIRTDMKDLNAQNNLPALAKIQVSDETNNLLKEIEFNTILQPRLLLRNVIFKNPVTGLPDNKYEFKYKQELSIPSLGHSYAQDFWGYFNGAYQNTMLPYNIITHYINNVAGLNTLLGNSANRKVNPVMAQAGMLDEIIYPTGGKTKFDYESNKMGYHDYNDIPIILQNNNEIEYETMFERRAVTNGTTVTNDDASIDFTVTSEIQGARIKTFESNNDPTNFANTICYISQYPVGYNPSTTQCGHTATVTPYPNYLSILMTECYKTLPVGQYHAYIACSSFDGFTTTSYMSLEKPITPPGTNNVTLNVGGMRIKKITNYDNNIIPTAIKEFDYPIDYNNQTYNAKMKDVPQFVSSVFRNYRVPSNYFCLECNNQEVYTLNSTNIIPSPGYHIEYPLVIEKFGENGSNGKIEHYFSESATIGGYKNKPYAPPAFLSWIGGLPVKKSALKSEPNSTFSLVTDNTQSFQGESFPNWSGFDQNLKVSINKLDYCLGYPGILFPASDNDALQAIANCFAVEFVPVYTENFVPTSNQEKTYQSGTTNSINQVSNNLYAGANKLLPSEKNTINSKQKMVRQVVKYPQDYTIPNSATNDDFTKGIQVLLQNNMLDVPVESYTIGKDQLGNDVLLNATINKINTLKPIVDQTYKLLLQTPLPLSQFVPATVTGTGVFVKDSRYKLETNYIKYSNENNLLEYKKTDNDIYNSILWDYKSTLPIAEIENATNDQVAATSFEYDGTGNFTINSSLREINSAVTGNKAYNLTNGPISKSSLNGNNIFIVSYWSKNGIQAVTGSTSTKTGRSFNGFTYYEHEVTTTGIITITGNGIIDEIRLYPKGALMTTYTYIPLIGMSSLCDANNKISYYEYDRMNRLCLTRDQDNNIIKKICYNYAGQPENCINCTNFTPNWQNTATALRCQQGSCGNTGYQEQEQKDMNPCSPTYNQTQWIVAGYNPTACPLASCVNLTSTNTAGLSGYTASYYNNTTGITYNLAVPATTGLQSLGTIPAGNYTLTISRTTGYPIYATFKSGCKFQVISGTSAIFYNVGVSTTICNSITIELAN